MYKIWLTRNGGERVVVRANAWDRESVLERHGGIHFACLSSPVCSWNNVLGSFCYWCYLKADPSELRQGNHRKCWWCYNVRFWLNKDAAPPGSKNCNNPNDNHNNIDEMVPGFYLTTTRAYTQPNYALAAMFPYCFKMRSFPQFLPFVLSLSAPNISNLWAEHCCCCRRRRRRRLERAWQWASYSTGREAQIGVKLDRFKGKWMDDSLLIRPMAITRHFLCF